MVQVNHQQKLYLKKKYKRVIEYLLQLKEDKEEFNIPEGFKFITKTFVKYNYRLAPHMIDYLGESRYICYEILEEIIFDACNSSFIEPYVEVYTSEEVEIEPEKIHHWSPDLTMAYIDLDEGLRFHGIFAADALEDGIRKILKKDYENNDDGITLKVNKGIFNPKWAKEGIKIKKAFCKKLENNERRRQEENEEKIELEKREEKNNKMKPIYIMNRKKLKEQFRTIREKNQRLIKEKFEEE